MHSWDSFKVITGNIRLPLGIVQIVSVFCIFIDSGFLVSRRILPSFPRPLGRRHHRQNSVSVVVMATELPSVTQTGSVRDPSSVDATGHNNNSKVVISIDNTALLHSQIEPMRARSLNRLDSLDDGQADMYRCPSFPRLQKRCNSQLDSIANCSMTHLETNSMSPRVSTDNLTNITRDDCNSRDRLSLGGYPGLMRSVSSRTVDELPPLEFPVSQFERLGHNYLSPNQAYSDKVPQPVSRSTSCPSMSYVRRSPSPHSMKRPESPRSKAGTGVVSDTPLKREQGGLGDARLEGEIFNDLTNAPGRKLTEFLPETGEKGAIRDGSNTYEEHPMHTKRLLEKQRERLSLIKQNGELQRNRQQSAGQEDGGASSNRLDSYVNIGDIPSAVAERVMDKKVHGTRGVQKKCLQWLNSLDNDDSS